MIKKKYLVLVFLLVFSVSGGLVQAQQDQTDPKRLEREKRVSQRISQLKPNLTDAQKRNYKARCSGAQTKVSSHLENAKKFSVNHDKKFDEFLEKSDKLVTRLQTSGRDAASAKLSIEKAIKTNQEIKSAYENYILALADTAQLDCQADPEGFRASIDEAKQQFKDLRKLRQEVKQTIKQDLKTALQSILSGN